MTRRMERLEGTPRLLLVISLAAGLVLTGGTRAEAHTGSPATPDDLWSSWGGEPLVLLGLGLSLWLYARGVGRLWSRAGRGRGIRPWQLHSFAAGIVAAGIALASPLDALGSALFSAHMVQHELLILVAAPLLVLGDPLLPFLWSLPMRWRRRLGRVTRHSAIRIPWRWLNHAAVAWTLHAVALWIWHAPALYQWAVRNDLVHAVQHLSFLGTALLFWWVLRGMLSHGSRAAAGLGVLYLFTTAMHGSLLGALLTFTPSPWYPVYADRVGAWGLSPMEDQLLGGLIMWIPPGFVYLTAALLLLALWLRSLERRVRPMASHGATVHP